MLQDTDSVIFDLDGTLWDSTATVAAAWQAAAAKVDFDTENISQQDIRNTAGMPYNAIYEKLYPSLNEHERQELMKKCAEEELIQVKKQGGQLYEGLEDTLRYLRDKYRLFIVSNCQSGYIEGFMEHHNLGHYFDDCECFGSAQRPKAENIKEIIRRNNLQSPVYVGDTLGDQTAAQKSGVPFIYARYGFGHLPQQPYTIDRLTDLKKLL